MKGKYILDGHMPVACDDFMKWSDWFERTDRYVDMDNLPGGIAVSTVFLGLDHRFGDGLPLLFETMIFGGRHDRYQDRYATWDEAVAGHAKALKMARDALQEAMG